MCWTNGRRSATGRHTDHHADVREAERNAQGKAERSVKGELSLREAGEKFLGLGLGYARRNAGFPLFFSFFLFSFITYIYINRFELLLCLKLLN